MESNKCNQNNEHIISLTIAHADRKNLLLLIYVCVGGWEEGEGVLYTSQRGEYPCFWKIFIHELQTF